MYNFINQRMSCKDYEIDTTRPQNYMVLTIANDAFKMWFNDLKKLVIICSKPLNELNKKLNFSK